MDYLAQTMQGDFLFGANVGVAGCYLFVMLLPAKQHNIEAPADLTEFRTRMMEQPSVQKAMKHEGHI